MTTARLFDIEVIGLAETIAEFYRIEAEQFRSEGSSGSGKWKTLSPAYAKRKLKQYGPKPILEATGGLRDSLTKATAKGAAVEKTAQELTLGSSLPTAGYHQRGGGKLPQRKVIDLTPEAKERLIKPVQQKMKQLAANAKLRHLQSI